ncbi:MAG: protein translocase subunit SecD [Arenicellales bacterium]
MNQYPLWKYLLILAVILPGVLYSLPNLYGEDPGIQIAGKRGHDADASTLSEAEGVLEKAGIKWTQSVVSPEGVRLQFTDTDAQLKAKTVLQGEFANNYTVALTLLPATPGWLRAIGGVPMYLGLDLRGGVHFLMEVNINEAVKKAESGYVSGIRSALREAKIRYLGVESSIKGGIEIKLKNDQDRQQARDVVAKQFPDLVLSTIERGNSPYLVAKVSQQRVQQEHTLALQQNMKALRNRIDELGVTEPVVQQQGDSRIVVELPGVQDTARAKEIIGRTATLEVKMVDHEHDLASAIAGNVPPGSKLYDMRRGGKILLKDPVIYSGDNIIDASAGLDQRSGGPVVHITLDSRGAERNRRVTRDNVGNRMAVVYIEDQVDNKLDKNGNPVFDNRGNIVKVTKRVEQVITAPVIKEPLAARFQITGLDSMKEARDLALLLRAGALAAPMHIVEERTVGPSLGRDNIKQGFESVLLGFVLVLVFMVVYYRMFGLVACAALFANLVLMVGILSILQATLTLPGVAGIVLTVGMAVDANVLIYERIREELRNGNTPQASIHMGYDRALATILDSNITTLIAGIVLFNFGTGPIKGFAVTLSIGIVTSVFTAIYGTRAIVNLVYGGRRIKSLSI